MSSVPCFCNKSTVLLDTPSTPAYLGLLGILIPLLQATLMLQAFHWRRVLQPIHPDKVWLGYNGIDEWCHLDILLINIIIITLIGYTYPEPLQPPRCSTWMPQPGVVHFGRIELIELSKRGSLVNVLRVTTITAATSPSLNKDARHGILDTC